MQCKNCRNDLLMRIEPRGLGNLLRLVPMAPYRCVKCGARNWLASDDWGRTGTRAALMAGVLAAMVWAIWYANAPAGPKAPANVIREEVVAGAPPVLDIPAKAPSTDADRQAPKPPLMVAHAGQGSEPQAEPRAEPQAEPVTTESLRRSAMTDEPLGQALEEVDVQPAPQAAPDVPGEKAAPEPGTLNPPPGRLVGEPAKATAGPGTIREIDFLPESDRLLISVAAGGPVENTELHFWPPKFVVDIPGRWSWSGPQDIPVGKQGVVRIRTGADKDKFRIVLDMDPAPKTQPQVQASPGGLLILVQ